MANLSGVRNSTGRKKSSILDCRTPLLMGAIEACGSIAAVNDFAQRLSAMTDKEMLQYKAALSATECRNLQSAATVLDHLDHYMLDARISSPEAAAVTELKYVFGDNDVERLLPYVQLPAYGRDLLEHDNAVLTPYGRMDRDDFQPMQAPFQLPSGMVML